MINAVHIGVYSKDAETDRNLFRDLLGFRCGLGWPGNWLDW